MANGASTYTYRAGRRLALRKDPGQFVVRALPERLKAIGVAEAERVSSSSSRVRVATAELERLMGESRRLATTHHAYYEAETGQEFLITDRVIVIFKQGVAPADIDVFAGRYALTRQAELGPRTYLFQLTDHTGMNPVKLVVKLNEDEKALVESAEHDLNQRMAVSQFTLPTDPAFARQWHLHTALASPDFDTRASSRCAAAWQLLNGFGSSDVVVGITDDGCKLDHPDLDSPDKFAGWGYFRQQRLVRNGDVDASRSEMYKSGSNHGTSCAGVIAGEVDASLTVGAAPGCRLLPVQWESSGPSLFISDSKLLTALDFFADKIDVMSNSWGGAPSNVWSTAVQQRIAGLAATGGRRGRGIVFLWAAGNNNCPISLAATLDVPYTDGWQIQADGSRVWVGVQKSRQFSNSLVGIAGVMHVAALSSLAQRSHYSNYGPGVLICAPTNNVHEYRRLSVRGLGITTTTGAGGGVTDVFGGTSSATPLVAGIAALVISANPLLSAADVVSVLKRTAAKDLSLTGYGPTPPATFDPTPIWDVSPVAPFDSGDFAEGADPDGSWSPWFGHGRVDAADAVAEALRRAAPAGGGLPAFSQTSTPAKAIPDNDQTGIRDVIACPAAGTVGAVRVTVDITHTFIGDLRIALTAPSGATAVLHDRAGGSAHDIRRSFDAASVAALAGLAAGPMQGNWTLAVQDVAARDTGTLNSWTLEIQPRAQSVIDAAEAPGAAIPDNRPAGIERILAVSGGGRVVDIEVAVDITHSYIGDLVVELTPPAGAAVPLHQRSGGGTDNLIATFTSASVPGLQALRGQPVAGSWRLKVADLEAVDIGKLNRWSLRIASAA